MSDNDFNKGVEADLDPAIEHFRQKTAMTREQIDALSAEMRRRVFFITGLADLELIKRVQLSLAKSVENGETFKDWKKRIRQELTDPKFTEKRLRTIFRTNVQNIFATGRYAALTSDAARKRKPYWKFSAIRDGRTTRVCKQSHGVILHMDHPWWKNHIPPLHFNCRSTIVPLSEKEARAAGITQFPPEELPPLGFGHLPDPIITASGQVPSEEERQKREQLADEAREAEERATAAAQKATEARKNLRKAKKHNIAQLPAAEKALRAAEKQAAIEEKKARAKGENVPRNWQPTEAGLIRRFGKKLAAPLIAAWRAIGNRWDQFKRGDLMRLLTDESGSAKIWLDEESKPYDLNNLSEQDKRELFGEDEMIFEWWQTTRDSASDKEREAVAFYKGPGHHVINNALRSGKATSDEVKAHIDNLSKVLRASKAPKDLLVYRGVGRLSVLKKLYPQIAPKRQTAEAWVDALQNKLKVGDIPYIDKAFTSTSVNPKKDRNRQVRLEIEIDKGQSGVAYIIGNTERRFQKEQEILIDKGVELMCKKVRLDGDKVILRCRFNK